MQEEENGGFMHERTLRKRAGLSHESSYSPPQSAVEAFEVIDTKSVLRVYDRPPVKTGVFLHELSMVL